MASIDPTDTDTYELTQDQLEPVIAHHVSITQSLNDELLRTIRVHTIIIGVLASGVAVLGFDMFLSPRAQSYFGVPPVVFWIFGLIALLLGLWYWMTGFSRFKRQPYSELRLGVCPTGTSVITPTVDDCLHANYETIEAQDEHVTSVQQKLTFGLILLLAGLILLVF